MIRIRQSWLESYRRVVATDYGREDELIASIRGEPVEPNWMMLAGSAWHDLLSCDDLAARMTAPEPQRYGWLQQGEYRFGLDATLYALERIGLGLWEVPGSLEILPGVSIEGTADHIRGLVIQDNKTKFTTIDAAAYDSSLQWRTYLLIHHAKCFRYNLWRFADPAESGFCELRWLLTFKMWPYTGMLEEVRGWVSRFVDWAAMRGLLGHLERDPYARAA